MIETSYHYNKKVVLAFDPVKHIYTMNGEKLKGVTTALQILAKPALITWAAKMAADYIEQTLEAGIAYDEVQIKEFAKAAQWAHRAKKDTAADTGTMIHQWIQDYVEGKDPKMPVNEGMQQAIKNFVEWWTKQDVKVLKAEQKLCSRKLKLAGTADLVCELNGKLTVLDWKTGSGIYPEMLLQMGAYAMMYQEEFKVPVRQLGVVNCSVKSGFKVFFTNDVRKLTSIYKKVLQLVHDMDYVEEHLKKGSK